MPSPLSHFDFQVFRRSTIPQGKITFKGEFSVLTSSVTNQRSTRLRWVSGQQTLVCCELPGQAASSVGLPTCDAFALIEGAT
jgi:hypothetical protein